MRAAILIAGLAVATGLLVWAALEASHESDAAELEGVGRLKLGCWSFGQSGARVLLCRELPRG